MKSELTDLQRLIVDFVEARDWRQFHNLKDLALCLNLESAEVLEHFQWRDEAQSREELKDAEKRAQLSGELADVFYWLLLMSHYLEIDLGEAVRTKMAENEVKYPVSKARGSAKKYTEHQKSD